MAKAIAHITGTALVPGVSKNRRWYTPEIIAGAVAKAQQRIGGEGLPLTMMTHHQAEDDSTRIIGRVTSVFLGEDGSAKFTADLADTEHGRTIASLVDSSDGQPFLSTVSIRGAWEGRVRKVTAPDGKPAEQGESLDLDGWDMTKAPGVSGARIDAFSWASGGQTETTERVLITESAEVAEMVVEPGETHEGDQEATEETPAAPEDIREALAVFLGEPLTEADNATPAISRRGSGMSGGGRKWADPGYQADHKQRYDITTKSKALTAWRYIHQASKAAKYSSSQLKNIRSRIRSALKGFGVTVSTEAAPGWGFMEAFQVSPEVAEYYGDPERSGSWSVSASNGPVNLSLSSYSMDPADLQVILRAAASAACGALAALDPDMDGDIDVPGADSSDTDHDGGHESAPSPLTTETEPADAGDEGPAPAGTGEQEDAGMATENSTEGGAVQSGLSNEALAKLVSESAAAAVTAAFEAREVAKAAAKEEARAAEAREAAEAKARKDALTEALAELGIKIPAPGAETAATESAADTVTESVDDRVKREVSEAITEFKQGLIAGGAILPARAGLVVREHAIDADTAPDREALQKMSDDELTNYLGGALAQQADAIRPVGAGA